MLLTNQWLDKLAALRVDFRKCGMLNGTCFIDGLNMELGTGMFSLVKIHSIDNIL
jgi:hypothetical protein